LREVMAARESVQERLDKVVMLIAGNMVAEVSSLYLLRRDGSLELFATEGLNREAVHNTHLKPGEGLVGLIAEQAEARQFPDAQTHPAFSFRPETGERGAIDHDRCVSGIGGGPSHGGLRRLAQPQLRPHVAHAGARIRWRS